MFHPALWMLMRLQWRGGFRQFRNSIKSTRGIIHLGFVVAMMAYGIASMYFAGMAISLTPQISSSLGKLQNDVPAVALFLFTAYVLLFSTGDATVCFTPSEIAFLFPAPVSRMQLLSYKLLKSLFGIFGFSAMMTLFMPRNIAMAVPRMLSIAMTLSFLQLLTMNVAFARQVMQAKIHQSIRIVLGAVIGIGLLFAVAQILATTTTLDLADYATAIQRSPVALWLLWPFRIFVQAFNAERLLTYLPSASVVLFIDICLLTLAYRLDALSLEAALASSEKMAARMKNMQAKGVWHAFASADSSIAGRRIPQLPFLAGLGPVVWQQMTTTFRSSSKLLVVIGGAVSIAAWIVYAVSLKGDESSHMNGSIAGVVAMGYMSFLICLTMQNEIERVGFLKSLPIATISIVIGELLGFVVLLSFVQSLFFAGLAWFFPAFAIWLLSAMVLLLPVNFVMFAVDKVVFYVYPTRLAKGAPGDFQKSGKQMIFMMMKLLMLGAAIAVVAIAALPGALILHSPLIAVASAVIVLAIECSALTVLLVLAFDRFDAGTATAG